MKTFNLNNFFTSTFIVIFCFLALKVQSQANIDFDCSHDIRLNSATLNQLSTNTFEFEFIFDYTNATNTTFEVDVEISLDQSTNLVVSPFTLTLDPNETESKQTVTATIIDSITVNNNGTIIFIPDDLELAGSIDFNNGGTTCTIAEIQCNFVNNALDSNPENDDYLGAEELPQTSNNTNDDNDDENTEPIAANSVNTEEGENNDTNTTNNGNSEEEDGTIILVDEIYSIERIYPNPAKIFTTIEVNNQLTRGNNTLIIYNNHLNPIKKIAIYERSTSIRVSTLAAGIYYLKMVNSTNESTLKKLIVY